MEVGPLQGGWALSPTCLLAGCSLLVGKAEEPAGGLEEQEHLCLPSWGGEPHPGCVYIVPRCI